tara:strand:+ start:559 stop:765 length:207 start_codon:yes stop_codon:yes gene_type:complete
MDEQTGNRDRLAGGDGFHSAFAAVACVQKRCLGFGHHNGERKKAAAIKGPTGEFFNLFSAVGEGKKTD